MDEPLPLAVVGLSRSFGDFEALRDLHLELEERINGWLERLGLEHRRDVRPGELSRGMRQKVGLGWALIRH